MIDLHLHTTASDGTLSPAELLQKAEGLGLDLISITDHYTVAGYEGIKDPAVRSLYSGRILPGCEYSAHYKDISIEILGYGIDTDQAAPFLVQRYGTTLREKWLKESEGMIQHYRAMGFPFDEEEVRQLIAQGLAATVSLRTALMRHAENRAALLHPEAAEDGAVFLRKEYANPESPFFFPGRYLHASAKEVCDEIHRLGGVAVLAHPMSYNTAFTSRIEEMIQEVDLDGLEVWYSTHTAEHREYLAGLCEKYNLIFSGGSDFHNLRREEKGNILGIPQYKEVLPLPAIMNWIEKLKTI